jgi:N-(2-amino-2-carboxyethyl)-L-glutamate synthase
MTAPEVSHSLRLEALTNTPLQAVLVNYEEACHRLWLKLEQHNPTGSIKYRTAIGLLAALDAQRPLVPGTRIIESTSGNLGLALARVLPRLDCQLLAVIDPKVSASVRDTMVAEGAELVLVQEPDEHGSYLLNRLGKVRELCQNDPELRWPDQYNNPANPNIHRDTIAQELLDQTSGRLDAVFIAVSTGGTLAGISEGLRASIPCVRVYAVDVHGSLVTANVGRPHLLTGVGATRKSSFLFRHHYHQALRVIDIEAFAYCRMLASDTGLAVGGSSGAVLAAFGHELREGGSTFQRPVAVIPDGATSYRSTFYDDRWLAERGVLDRVRGAEAEARAHGLSFDIDMPIGGGNAVDAAL